MLILAAALLLQTAPVAVPATCRLTEADKAANRALDFRQFDQGLSQAPHTAWNLGQAGCYREALEATQDYLVYGPKLNRLEALAVTWHMVLQLANMGREDDAAVLASATINDAPPPNDGLDWNTYARGVWAFLSHDRPLLDRSLATLATRPGQRNALNARTLARLSRCFGRPYAEATRDETCVAG